MNINIELTPQALEVIRKMEDRQALLAAVARGMDLANQLTVRHISDKRLTGMGPFPPSEHRLGTRTGKLLQALQATTPEISGETVECAIGDNMEYAAIHEFGGRIQRKARSGTVRLRTDSRGDLLRQIGYGRLAVFARKSHKRAKEVAFQAEAYEVNMPERAPIRTGINERLEVYGRKVSEAVVQAWEQGK